LFCQVLQLLVEAAVAGLQLLQLRLLLQQTDILRRLFAGNILQGAGRGEELQGLPSTVVDTYGAAAILTKAESAARCPTS
jgi:hypothetical protein